MPTKYLIVTTLIQVFLVSFSICVDQLFLLFNETPTPISYDFDFIEKSFNFINNNPEWQLFNHNDVYMHCDSMVWITPLIELSTITHNF